MPSNRRLTADDPQVALAQRTAARLDAGTPPAAAVPAEQVDLAQSFDPFVLIFDANGACAGLVGDAAQPGTRLPDGCLRHGPRAWRRSRDLAAGERRPQRQVAVAWQGGFVIAGRSLRLTEQHVNQIGLVVGWLATLTLVAAAAVLVSLINPPRDWPPFSLGPWRMPRAAPPIAT